MRALSRKTQIDGTTFLGDIIDGRTDFRNTYLHDAILAVRPSQEESELGVLPESRQTHALFTAAQERLNLCNAEGHGLMLDGVLWESVEASGLDLRYMRARGAEFAGCDLRGIDARHAEATAAKFLDIDLPDGVGGSICRPCDLSYACFDDAYAPCLAIGPRAYALFSETPQRGLRTDCIPALYGTSFRRAYIEGALITGKYLRKEQFEGAAFDPGDLIATKMPYMQIAPVFPR